jgi:UPF0176 protein
MIEQVPRIKIAAFYQFVELGKSITLTDLKQLLREEMELHQVFGTIIIATEGYNGMVCGEAASIDRFTTRLGTIFGVPLCVKASFDETAPFRKIDVKIKAEIVTLRRDIDLSLAHGTHVEPARWNELISDPETLVLDARNDYEYKTGTFRNAVNPATAKFSDLPEYVESNLDAAKHKRVAMFCTGGIRCEKFTPYLKGLGFEEVYQLEGGILNYLAEIDSEESLWEGECFVFDERITVDASLRKGTSEDKSQRFNQRKRVW